MLAQILSRFSVFKVWLCLILLQIAFFASLYAITRSYTIFYGIGFLILLNACLYFYPLWAIHNTLPPKTVNSNTIRLQAILNSFFPPEKKVRAELHTSSTLQNNFLVYKFKNHVVLSVDHSTLDSLSYDEMILVFTAMRDLNDYRVLDAAMLLSAFYHLLPFMRWVTGLKNASAIELCYLTAGESPAWHRLNLKILHRQRKTATSLPTASRPQQLFPMLTLDKKDSYFSVYKITRDNLLLALQSEKE